MFEISDSHEKIKIINESMCMGIILNNEIKSGKQSHVTKIEDLYLNTNVKLCNSSWPKVFVKSAHMHDFKVPFHHIQNAYRFSSPK